ncbi:MAG: ABC transporter permease [Mesorhizobium sp.]
MAAPSTQGRPSAAQSVLLGLPAVLVVGFVVIAPLVLLIRISFDLKSKTSLMTGAWSVQNFTEFFASPFYQQVLANTVLMSAATTIACLLLGFPLAYFIARTHSAAMKSAMMILLVLPMFIGNSARVVGWATILADRGILNGLFSWLGYSGEPIRMLYTAFAVFISLVSVLLPYVVIVLQGTINAIPKSLEEAATGLGGGPLTVVTRVLLPLAMPGIFAAASLAFILAMSAYAAPVLLGGSNYQMLGPLIYQQMTKVSNWPFAAAIATILVVTSLLVTVVSNKLLERRFGRV